MKKVVTVAAGLAALLLCSAALAESAPAVSPPAESQPPVVNRSVNLQDAVTLAMRYSPLVRQAGEDVRMGQAREATVAAAGRPSLSTTLFASKSSWSNILSTPDATPPVNLMGIPPGSFLDQNVTAMFPLYTAGRVAAATRSARALEGASAQDEEAARQDAALQVRIAYRRAVYQEAVVAAQQQNLAASQEQLRLDTDRFQVGKLAEVTLYRDRTLTANAQQDVTNAMRDRDQALFALDAAIGVSVQSHLTLTDALLSGSAKAPPSITDLLTSAAARRPEVRAAAERTASAAAELTRARSASKPQVNLMGMGDFTQAGRTMPNGLNYTVGIAAGLPIFEGGALSAGVRESAAALRKARAAESMTRLQVEVDVADALSNAQAAGQNIVVAQAALAQAEEDYQVQQIRFTSGKGIQLEVLDALAALTAARTQVDRTAFEYAVSQDQLLRASGEPLPGTAVESGG